MAAPNASAKSKRSSSATRWWWVFAVLAFITAGYATLFIAGSPAGDPGVRAKLIKSAPGVAHVVGGMIAMVLGPFQFLPGLRSSNPAIHR